MRRLVIAGILTVAIVAVGAAPAFGYFGVLQSFRLRNGADRNNPVYPGDYLLDDGLQANLYVYPNASPYSVTGIKVNSIYSRRDSGDFVEIGYGYDSIEPGWSISKPMLFTTIRYEGVTYPSTKLGFIDGHVGTWRNFVTRRETYDPDTWSVRYNGTEYGTWDPTGIQSSRSVLGMERLYSTDNGNASFMQVSSRTWPYGSWAYWTNATTGAYDFDTGYYVDLSQLGGSNHWIRFNHQ